MGRPGAKPGGVGGAGSKTLAVTVGADGGVNYDAIVKQGGNKNKWIASTHGAMVPKLDKLKDVRATPSLGPCMRVAPLPLSWSACMLPLPLIASLCMHRTLRQAASSRAVGLRMPINNLAEVSAQASAQDSCACGAEPLQRHALREPAHTCVRAWDDPMQGGGRAAATAMPHQACVCACAHAGHGAP